MNKGDDSAEKFKEINEAFSVLSDDQKKSQYDQFGSDAFKGGFSGFDTSGFQGFGGFEDIFETFFGGGRRRRSSVQRGADLRYDVEITLEEAAFGAKKTISVRKHETCKTCQGKGGKGTQSCSNCQGTGVQTQSRRTPFGMFQTQTTCSKCQGQGEIVKDVCEECHGKGRKLETKKLEVDIPAGVATGFRLRVANEGEAGLHGGPSGDLYLFIHEKEHKIFERDENDVVLKVPIRFAQAALGDEIEVPTLDGKAKLKIPKGTQPGTLFKMSGKGIPFLHGYGKGDQLVEITVEVPKKLSKKQEEIITKLDKEIGKKKSILEAIMDSIK